MVSRGLLGLAGLVAPFLGLIYFAAWIDCGLLDSYINFSRSIHQGDFSDAHRVIVAYLWHAEGGMLVLWLVAAALPPVLSLARREKIPPRAWLWLTGLAAIALSFIVFSNGLGKFVVYGRLVRQLVPFFALLAGWAAVRIFAFDRTAVRGPWALATAVIAIAAVNFRVPLTQEFGFAVRARQFAAEYRQRAQAEGRPPPAFEKFVVINAGYLWPLPDERTLPPHELLLSGRHPLQFRPFLYEGFDRRQRAVFFAADIRPRLVLIKD
jgi:hypothetical protein